LSNFNGGHASTQIESKPLTLKITKGPSIIVHGMCPYNISPSKITKLANFHALLCELKQHVFAKVVGVEGEKKKHSKS
jgi:hypothetical protein